MRSEYFLHQAGDAPIDRTGAGRPRPLSFSSGKRGPLDGVAYGKRAGWKMLPSASRRRWSPRPLRSVLHGRSGPRLLVQSVAAPFLL